METLARSTWPLVVSVSTWRALRLLVDGADRWWDRCEWEDSLEVVRERESESIAGDSGCVGEIGQGLI